MINYLGGFVVGAAIGRTGMQTTRGIFAWALANVLFAIVGFFIAGALTGANRFKHLLG